MTQSVGVPQLARALRRRDLIGILINTMIGSGMMAAPAKVFALAHGWSFAVLGLSALFILPVILCFADLGSRFSGTGGPYLYARATLPGWMAYSTGWLLWISQVFSTATLTNLLLSYLAGFFPALNGEVARAAAIVAIGAIGTIITLLGIHGSARTSNLLVLLKIGFVLAFVLLGAAFLEPEHFVVRAPPPPPTTLARAILIYVFAYTGFEKIGILAGEAREPRKDVPWAFFAGLVVATAAYAGVLLVCVGVLGDPSTTDRPLAEAAGQLFGPAGAAAVSIGAITVIVGTILVALVTMPRLLMAIAEQGQLPAFLSVVHPRSHTPHIAILISGVLTFTFAIFGDLLGTLTFSTASRVVCYILCCFALWKVSRRAEGPPAQFRLPGPAIFAVVSASLLVIVLVMGATKELPALGVAMVLGLAIYAISVWSRRAVPPVVAEPSILEP